MRARQRQYLLELLCDGALVALAFALAFLLRFDLHVPQKYLEVLRTLVGPVVAAKLVTFYLMGLYRRVWRYAGVGDFLRVAWASVVGTLAITLIIFLLFRSLFPRSVVALDGVLTLVLVGGVRFLYWGTRELRVGGRLFRADSKRTLVVGAGDTGTSILREMSLHPEFGYQPVGLVDDDPGKQGLRIHGTPVLGTRAQLETLVRKHDIQQVIICMPSASRQVVRDVAFRCRDAGVECKTLPGLYEIITGSVGVSQLREVRVEDVLGREPVTADLKVAAGYISGKTVLVTGAAGSIGSEICRQVSRLGASALVMLDQSEGGLVALERELGQSGFVAGEAVVADVTNMSRVRHVFQQYRPSVVFHAAAYKHVHLMETNPVEAVETDMLGTKRVVEAATDFGAERFVLISTDKAVEPGSTMGQAKALAERLVRARAMRDGTAFMVVRFGNVLDSSGSVIPIFRQQIANGGPVTVTHPEMRRYFMTIPEAVQLVIQAGAMGRGAETFVLDMGEQVSILEVARNMIQLSGLAPDEDIAIEFTGVRPGEKLDEKLLWDYEEPLPTSHEKIWKVENSGLDVEQFMVDMERLEGAVLNGEYEQVQTLLFDMCARHLSTHEGQ